MWKGAISFGLVSIPVGVVAATENRSVSFHQYHLEDMGRIRTRKVCELDNETVAQDDIGRGYETATGDLIEVTDADLAALPLPTAKAIEIVAFVPAASINPISLDTGYYLAAAGPVAAKPYTLLRRALERSSKVAVAKFAWHGRERLGLLRVKDDAIVLQSLKWPDEIRSEASLAPPAVEVTETEIDAALTLTDTLAADDLTGFTDHYREAVEALLAAKSGTGTGPAAAGREEQPAAQVVDLMAALQASVRDAQQARGETTAPADATVHALPKKTAKKPARKAAKKTAAKKAAGGRGSRSA
ncbi:Ku protein [Streptomyces sp. NPDC001941]|uniref:non-homologous end joining protein Ku n=1 Tax=Streptomyces sp. NPDC001941 TaxID=3154659 RepID=UPI00332831F2